MDPFYSTHPLTVILIGHEGGQKWLVEYGIGKNIRLLNCALYEYLYFGCSVFLHKHSSLYGEVLVSLPSLSIFRIPVPVNGSGQFKMRRQSSELFLEGALSPPCQRMGAMVAFQCFDDFKRSLLN